MKSASVSAGYVNAFLAFAQTKGADQPELLRQSSIQPVILEDADNRVPLDAYQSLMQHTQIMCQMPEIALAFGAGTDLEQISVLGIISQASNTMADAFAMANRYGPLVDDVALAGAGDRFAKIVDKQGVWFVDQRATPNAFPELTETTFARIVSDINRHFDGRPKVIKVLMTHAAPAHAEKYQDYLQSPIEFSSNKNALLFAEDWNAIPMPRSNQYLFGALASHAEDLLCTLKAADTVRAKVEQILLPLLHTGDVSMETVAKQLNQSRPTLYRKLKTEGVNFEQIHDQLRKTMALDYLSSRKVSVNETAYLVGFADASSFSRAFKRWTGDSPRQFKPE
ncbi:AraC family transcriptional regulator [Maritalea porphyrae]|jgi:AraC-like DNA-binding protein|uniref:AraC family transcriptional regulator n=1 Tax=Maritalea porphyrae TaxID=880732 RepID=UPI0022AFFAB9|nr:AraC family transcriptional regulator [Maritalea porphyrae]MCZ4271360.1 AraC family transcriptional regulator ligand-binding domain-containing protein [Maritalea porphyrae]